MENEYVMPENPENIRVLESVPKNAESVQSIAEPVPSINEKNDLKTLTQYRFYNFGCLLYALLYTFCLYKNPNGITYPFFVGGTLLFFCLFLKKLEITAKKDKMFYLVSILLLGISNCLTDSYPIVFMNKVGITLLMFIFMIHSFYRDQDWNFSKYFESIFKVILGSLLCFNRPFKDYSWYRKTKTGGEKNKKAFAVLIGILISIPLLIVILSLLYYADAIFAEFFDNFFQYVNFELTENLIGISFTFLFAFFASYCIWVYLCQKKIKADMVDKRTAEPLIATTFTGIISLVYLIFCFIQIRYLFLGNIPLSKGFNYSTYAREGFFQLLFVCIINLCLVLICLGRFQENLVLKILLTIITGCTYIMIASSVMRMLLYIIYYNLTFLRILVLWALFIISILITGVLVFIYKPKFPLFRFSMITVTVLFLVFSFSRPDYWIAKYNLQPHTFVITNDVTVESTSDYRYLTELSTDAAAVILSEENSFFYKDEPHLINSIYVKYLSAAEMGIRDFNFSRYYASKLIPPENQ